MLPRFSSRIGYLMSRFNPNLGVIFPLMICATPEMIGNLKSNTLGRILVLIICSRARAVLTPSDTPSMLSRISSMVSPFARRYPKRRLRDNGPKHVPKVSPTPARPQKVSGSAPKSLPMLLISVQPRVTREDMAFIPTQNIIARKKRKMITPHYVCSACEELLTSKRSGIRNR